jgi:3-hydroxybutyryl-CoA dehydrogenase
MRGGFGRGSRVRFGLVNVRAVGVVGLGTMGSGIAQVCVSSGFPTIGREPTKELAEQAREAIAARLRRAAERGRLTGRDRDEALARLTVTTQVGDLRDCDLVVEAAPERLGVKLQLFAELATFVGTDTLLATNTSALSVTEIAHATPLPERVLGLHFFNPAPVLPLVEVVRTGLTSDAVVETATAFVERLGKTPVVCGDTPGFIVNRLLIPVLNDAVRLLEEESAEAEAIDTAMRLGTSWPIGPLALIDLIGVDVHVAASEALWHACREPRLNPPGRLLSMLQAGHLGRKTGQGFYTYTA